MQVADSDTVLGDFADATVAYFDSTATFSKRDGKFFVSTDNAEGKTEAFEVSHTFGVAPLQQYLVEVPGGRKQALQFLWDARAESEGGQRWYHLYPDEYVGPGDPLHWTGRYFNWNFMCAECHSTDVKLGYNIESDTFDTSYAEISVGCEACHGAGSIHAAQAAAEAFDDALGLAVNLDDRQLAAWEINRETGIAERSRPADSQQQTETCGRCHARRSVIAADYEHGQALADTHVTALLEENLYHADGRIQDEVYVYGSFVQSKMYAAGVTCNDCHNPHSGQLHTGPDPNDICATCHLQEKFADVSHAGSESYNCVDCHMQTETYMGIDARRDHSFRLPDTASDPAHYGAVIAAGRQGGANETLLSGIADAAYPGIARATMLSLLGPSQDSALAPALKTQAASDDPLVRIGVLRALRNQPASIRVAVGSHLLADPIRAVRVEAALGFAAIRDLLPPKGEHDFLTAAQHFRDAMEQSAFMPDAALRLAEFENTLGNTTAADRMYQHALKVGSNNAEVQHAFGLYRVRQRNAADALGHLEEAALLAPDNPRFVYVYAIALNSLGQPEHAGEVLIDAWQRFPNSLEIGMALVTVQRDNGNIDEARRVARELAEQFPILQTAQLLESLGG